MPASDSSPSTPEPEASQSPASGNSNAAEASGTPSGSETASASETSAGDPAPGQPSTDQSSTDQPSSNQPASQQHSNELEEYEPLTPEIVEEEAIRGDFVMRWAVVLMAFLLGSTRIAETGTLVHVKTGQYLAAHGILPPAHDVFSYTAADRAWVNLSWGFDLLVAGLFAMGQFLSLSIAKALVIAISFWMIGRISRPGTPTWWGSVCSVLALLACHMRMSIHPTLVTLIGLAVVMSIVFKLRQSAASHATGSAGTGSMRVGSKQLWLLVPLFLVWSNFDTRAWLGLAFLLLYATGDSLGAWVESPVALDSSSRKQLWQVTVSSIAATIIHPFGWKSLAAPWFVYQVEYPAIRDYIQETVLETEKGPTSISVMYFPMTTEAFWLHLNLAGIASLTILVLALVAIFLNRARLDWGQFLAYLGFTLLAVVCLYELPVAAVVAGVVATLNGQEWYATRCRQTYSIATGELLFSRGGRVLTVLAFAAIGFFGGTGRLRDASAGRPGYGLDHNLGMQVDDLQRQLAGEASFDHRPFNTLLSQGDQLIWLGEQVFADSRVAVYYSTNADDNLLDQHLITRDALSSRRTGDAQKPAAGPKNRIWRKTFDNYHITHVVIRLRLNVDQDYKILSELLQETEHWEWTSLGSNAAVFYRVAVEGPEVEKYKKFLADHKIDFRKRAYVQADRLERGRDRPIRPPSFYKKHFWSTKIESPAEVLEAVQLMQLAKYPALPRELDASRGSMTYLAIRLAQAGLSKDPDATTAYLVLGEAYDFLSQLEYYYSNRTRSPRSGVRYLQAVAAFNQALIGDPDNAAAHKALVKLYGEAQRLDLVLQHILPLDQEMSAHPEDYTEDELLNTGKQVSQYEKTLKAFDDEIAQKAGPEPNPLVLVQAYFQRGCILRALRELEKAGGQIAGNPQIEQFRIALLLEAGRVDEAYEAAGRFVQMAPKSGPADLGDIMAIACLPEGEYEEAARRWLTSAAEVERRMLQKLVVTLPPRSIGDPNAPWPVSTMQVAVENFFQSPETIANMKMNAALTYLEYGEIKLAEQFFREVLIDSPDTQNRPLVRYYILEMTEGQEELDIVPPSDRVSESFVPESDEGSGEPGA